MQKDNIKILIADDEEKIRTTLEFILQDQNFKVEAMGSGEEALEKANEQFFNVAVLDYRLPDIDGILVGKNIKAINSDTEIVILTGQASLESAIKAVEEDFYDYLTKPVDVDKLIKVINGALEKQSLILENRNLFRELKKSNEQLEKLNMFKDGLISMISHDLRSPISSLKGFNYALMEGYVGELTGEQKEVIKRENDAIEMVMELTNNLLDMRQIEAGELQMKKEFTDMERDVIKPVMEKLDPQIIKKKLNVNVVCEENLPKVKLDAGRIFHVAQNLVQNAIKFTPENRSIGLNLLKAMGNQVELRVSDTGKGIPEKFLNSIFDVFYADYNGTGEKTGRGMGLAISKEIVKAHNGSIWAESEGVGKGSTFIVILPVDDEEIGNRESRKNKFKK